eukprot:TRINITY_DN6911_c1_g1_i1.p1 TRINITY_DN6911_c1_g1~~TRINITY_DN6911_c1_g1_i1.p1  ORF type:complete len:741 (+),score=143.60 TRINITY_DN6911_c1_g1_i1:845-3067(+)
MPSRQGSSWVMPCPGCAQQYDQQSTCPSSKNSKSTSSTSKGRTSGSASSSSPHPLPRPKRPAHATCTSHAAVPSPPSAPTCIPAPRCHHRRPAGINDRQHLYRVLEYYVFLTRISGAVQTTLTTTAMLPVLCSLVLGQLVYRRCPDGVLEGVVINNYEVYRGIPFAQPPVGDLRFRAPVPNDKWNDTLDAKDFRASCPQPGSPQTGLAPGWPSINVSLSSEDCLYLNVFMPYGLDVDSFRAVMVYFHAGEFMYGSSNDEENNFPYFTTTNILVTVNSRLGLLGYTALQSLAAEDPNGYTGNYGMQDQTLALQWIQRSIRSFGGDPKRITIFGESSGGASVSYHLTAKRSWPYFQAAILESPGVTQTKKLDQAEDVAGYLVSCLAQNGSPNCSLSDPLQYRTFPGHSIGGVEPTVKAPLHEFQANCTASSNCRMVLYCNDTGMGRLIDVTGPITLDAPHDIHVKWADMTTAVQCLRSADAFTMVNITAGGDGIWPDTFNTDKYAPVVDGKYLNDSIQNLVRQGQIANVPLISGSNMDEGTLFMSLVPPIACNATYDDYAAWAIKQFGQQLGSQLPPLYKNLQEPLPYCFGGDNSDRSNNYWYMAAMRTAGDSAILCRGKQFLLNAPNRTQTFQYYFTHTPNYSMNYDSIPYLGAFHGAEVPFAFVDAWELTTPAELVLGKQMGCYWSNFAESGNPNVGSQQCSFVWPSFADNEAYIVFNNLTLTSLNGLQKEQCDLFRQYP